MTSEQDLCEGRYEGRFAGVAAAFRANLESGADVGASFAVTLGDETVVDLWGGAADEARTRAWERDTIVNVFSATKTIAALTLLVLADRREIDLDAAVSKYWPEFRGGGKDRVKVRHFLSHASGLSGFDQPISVRDLYDWEKITALLAAQEPWWEPGSASGYHATTQGYLIGEVVRRVTGRSIGRFLREEITGRLSTDFQIGVAAADDARIGGLIPPPEELASGGDLGVELGPIARRTLLNPTMRAAEAETEGWRRAEIPAGNGHGNARSVAETLAVLANGGTFRGVRLLSEEGAARTFELQTDGIDLVLGLPICWGLGFGLRSEEVPLCPSPRYGFWGGYGGSLLIVDPHTKLTLAYVMNRMVLSLLDFQRSARLIGATYEALR